MLYAIALDFEETIVTFESGRESGSSAVNSVAGHCLLLGALVFNQASYDPKGKGEMFNSFSSANIHS